MSKQVVPWAPGRRALVRPLKPSGHEAAPPWVEAEGCGRQHFEAWQTRDERRSVRDVFFTHAVETALLPEQCAVCFEVGAHAEGCKLARNLAAGCPPWCAHVASEEVPENVHELWFSDLFLVHDDGSLLPVYFGDYYETGEPYAVVSDTGYDLFKGWPCTTGDIDPEWRWFVRIGRDGAMAPWEV